MNEKRFYVYVYIDPRNHQEFYYGKGQGDRKLQHLKDTEDSEKRRIIAEIHKEGLEPIIKVVARHLTEKEALLIEKTLIWKLGRSLTNKATGHFAKNFRRHNSLHLDLSGFDFENGLYCFNVGEGIHRNWDDCRKYNFLSGGQDWKKYGSRVCALRPGDVLCAYLSGYGYVGIGKVLQSGVPASKFAHNGRPLSEFPVKTPEMFSLVGNPKDGEFLLRVRWLAHKSREEAVGGDSKVWRSPSMLASLENQPKTVAFLEREFSLDFRDALKIARKSA